MEARWGLPRSLGGPALLPLRFIYFLAISCLTTHAARRAAFTSGNSDMPGEHFFQGQHCLSRYEPSCPIAGACSRGDNCAFWGSGIFHWHLEPFFEYMHYFHAHGLKVQAYRYQLPNATSCKETDLPGRWYYGQWRAEANTGCVSQRVSRPAMRECLRAKKVLFVGDSYLRQVMLRLIAYLRGFEHIIEHYFHSHGTYSYYDSADDNLTAADSLFVSWDWAASSGPLKPGEAFRLNFLWGLMEDTDVVERVRQFAPDVVVLGGFASARDLQLKGWVEDVAQMGQNTGKPSRMFVAPLPPGVWSEGNVTLYGQRVREQVKEYTAKYPAVRSQVLPVDRMGATSPFRQNEVEQHPTHYQCSYLPQWLGEGSVIEGFKAPPSRDCRDLFNFEVLMLMLNSMCS